MPNGLWEQALKNLAIILDDATLAQWIRPLDADIAADSKTLMLYAPNEYVQKEVSEKYKQTIELAIKNIEPTYQVEVKEGAKPIKDIFEFSAQQQSKENDKYQTQLDPELTFENFVQGSSNQIAASTAMGISKQPDGTFNPLLIYGSTGLGKTHLLQAVGNYIRIHHPEKKVVYKTGEQFVIEMVDAFGRNQIDEFKRRYRNNDVLLIDDVQFLAGKDRSQEEFFHVFNDLHRKKAQIVLTCDRFPKDVDNLEERLKSRFGAGMPVAVAPPDYETRGAILRHMASLVEIDIPDKVIFFIAEKVNSHVRDLQGAMNNVTAQARFVNKPVTIELVKEALRDLINAQARQISIENIQKVVATHFGVKVSDLKGKSRKATLTRPRQVAMSIASELTSLSTTQIGEAFNRDHSTVIHARRKVEELRKADPNLDEDYTSILTRLTG